MDFRTQRSQMHIITTVSGTVMDQYILWDGCAAAIAGVANSACLRGLSPYYDRK